MSLSISQQLAQFTTSTRYDDLPADVVHESKRILLDSIGCAIGGIELHKSRIAVRFAEAQSPGDTSATIFGSPVRSSIFGASFANGEAINALDFDAVLPPGHVSPYVLPGLLAVAEVDRSSGRDVLLATAISHEMTNRFGKAMDYIRDIVDGKHRMPDVLGYASSVFGATAAVTLLRGASTEVTSHALSIAASISPVNSHRSWLDHAPVSTIKYTMAGPIVQAALTAAYMAILGHRGDPAVFDDPEHGYRKFIGSSRWQPERLLGSLGSEWFFQKENAFKVYPHCRALHGLLDILVGILDQNSIESGEIQAIRAWGEGHTEFACWTTRDISDPVDGQFSATHGLAVGALRLPKSKIWHDPNVVLTPPVMDLMSRITYGTHPDWARLVATDPAARPSRVEVDAHGQTFVAELIYPKGTPGAAGGSEMSDSELADKFRLNVEGVLSRDVTERAVEGFFEMEKMEDVSPFLKSLGALSADA
ncbi:MmgE/PrpD family protein [Rhizobium leguminosarum bv. viciae]|uniref:MmgE/PrpD family protein n=1 Tax=Rhizobium leguminosarum TaxID=384 RepID=UPI0014429080|nr:MmgE/PrpD family protein [Rhizobium leguminosarum]NKK87444.1 MmgE/PrpD family protein [Rhizobium leguminosarum bv. viciae]